MMIALTRLHGLSRALGSFSSLRGCRAAQHVMYLSSSQEDSKTHARMLRHLVTKIKSTGPISVAEYMREVLTNPVTGYYVNNDMLGPDGDFITSPEISQIFGELLGVWCVSEWMGAGRPGSLQLVEFGPGRGSLMNDILRVLGQLRSALGRTEVSVHLVEVSPRLSQVQAGLLTGEQSRPAASEDQAVYRHGATPAGVPVSWYRHLDDVPRGFSLFLAHEFFDALPIHKFQRTPRGWREVMVDVDPEDRLRFVIIPAPTLASSTLIQVDERRDHVEVCPGGGVIVQQLANRIAEDGGAALIADYGHDGTKTDTFRGFKGHRLHPVLEAPGSADLTADVDFSYLRKMAARRGVACLGPLPQRDFLKNMGVDTRMQVLLSACKDDPPARAQLLHSYELLTGPAHMGLRFHFLCLLAQSRLAPPPATPRPPQGLKMEDKRPAPLPVAGFSELSFS
ncbi:protein arginine methyltransferase NDUFAF7, mitochondrial [Gadus chalcogrammus]|uniref:protein arginine methyltransferase NDUFAF7, mitochondrial n=1 Tax=Gadus chalcogrammus TaxID=1042646 RepID=UPI0024C4A40E|nr:protein arginine methyltransferase NDUFAF7, mitochondrial [Gadus chalcogrammus]